MESSLQARRRLSPPEMCVCACVRASEPGCDGSPAGRACPFCAPMRRVALVSFASPPPATLLGVSTHPSALFSSSLCQASSSQRFFCHVLEVLPVVSSHLLVYPAHLTRLHPTRRPSSRLFSHRRRPTLLSLLYINIDPPLSPIYINIGFSSRIARVQESFFEPVHRAEFTVPASTANLGPGFDSFGFALDVWNRVTVTRADKFSMVVHGEGEDRLDRSKDNLVVRMTEKVLQSLDKEVILFLHPPTHISHMSHPTFPISHLLFCADASSPL